MHGRSLAELLARLTAWSVRHGRLVVLVALATAAAAAYVTVRGFALEVATEAMIDPAIEYRRVAREFKAEFPELDDNLVILLESPVPEAAREAAAALERDLAAADGAVSSTFRYGGDFLDRHGLLFLEVERLEERIERIAAMQPFLATLAEEPTLEALFELLGQAAAEVADGLDPDPALARALEAMARTAEGVAEGRPQPLSWQRLLAAAETDPAATAAMDDAPELHREIVFAKPVLDPNRLNPVRPALDTLRALTERLEAEAPARLEVGILGTMALDGEELEGVFEDAVTAGLVSLALVLAILAIGLGTWQLVVAALVSLVLGIIITAAFTILAIGSFNVISITFAVLFIGLGIDFAIHFVIRYREGLGEALGQAVAHTEALPRASGRVGPALLLCMISTALAFLAFTGTAYIGLAQLGLISAVGVVVSFLLALTLLPALIAILPRPGPRLAWRPPAGPRRRDASGRLRLGLALILTLLALPALPRLSFDSDPIRLKDPNSAAVQAFERMRASTVGSPYTADVLAGSKEEARRLAEALAGRERVAGVRWLESFIPADQEEKLAILEDAAFFLYLPPPRDPKSVAEDIAALEAAWPDLASHLDAMAGAGLDKVSPAAARLREALEAVFADGIEAATAERLRMAHLRYFGDAVDRLTRALEAGAVTVDDLPDRLVRRYLSREGRYRLAVRPAAEITDMASLRRFVEVLDEVAPTVTGSPVQLVRSGEVVERAMLQASAAALLLVGLFLALVLRRPLELALVFLPVLLAGLWTAASTVWLAIPFNYANVIVLPLLIGLGVDSAIHLVMRRRELHGGAAIVETGTPRAVVLSALTTLGSFGTLAIADHRGIASMGQLLAISILATLFATLFVLPAAMAWIDRRRGRTAAMDSL